MRTKNISYCDRNTFLLLEHAPSTPINNSKGPLRTTRSRPFFSLWGNHRAVDIDVEATQFLCHQVHLLTIVGGKGDALITMGPG